MTVLIANEQKDLRVPRKRLREIVQAVVADHGYENAVVSVAVVDGRTVRRINRKYLGRDRITDVISFPLEDDFNEEGDFLDEGGWLLGEIVVCASRAKAVAKRRGGRPQAELLLYVVHGLLHLLGMDDDTARAAQQMHDRALEILMEHGVVVR